MQSFHQWQQSPEQGAIPSPTPFTRADEKYLTEVLVECRLKLQSALKTAQRYPQVSDLASAIGDAVTGCQEALHKISHNPQLDEVYDVALVHLPPTTGEVHPPESAF